MTKRIGFCGAVAGATLYAIEDCIQERFALEEAVELLGGAMAITRILAFEDRKDRHELGVMCLHALQTAQALVQSVQGSDCPTTPDY